MYNYFREVFSMEKKEKVVEKLNVEVCSFEIVNSVEILRMRLEEIRLV